MGRIEQPAFLFVGPYLEKGETVRTKAVQQRHVGGVAAAWNDDAAGAGAGVAW